MRARGFVAALRELQSLLCICPCCGEVFRLSEARLYYGSPPARTWFDRLRWEQERLARAEERFEERREELQERSRRAVERRLRKELRARDPVLSPQGYYPKDARVLVAPVDFVVFDGMHRGQAREVVLLDHEAGDRNRERVQRSLERAVGRGDVSWVLVRVEEDGRVEFEESVGS